MPAHEYLNPTTMDARLAALAARLIRGVQLDLNPMRRLLKRLGNPGEACPVIHVAGTNGKGSVCAFLAAIAEAAGYKVGLYTSPHLIRFNERLQVNRVAVTNDRLVELMRVVDGALGEDEVQTVGRPVTFFEYATALAFEWFRAEKVDLAILETGLGGRLDATNVVTSPVATAITSISMDHMDFLGNTLAEIAGEKAGIIKAGRPVIVAPQPPEVMTVLRHVAAERTAPLTMAADDVRVDVEAESLEGMTVSIRSNKADSGRVRLPVPGQQQAENAAIAVAVAEAAATAGFARIDRDAIRRGLEGMRWPGRLQLISKTPPVLLDCAHNGDGARRLAVNLKRLAEGRPVGLVLGMCRDKEVGKMLDELAGVGPVCWTVPLRIGRGMSSEELAGMAVRVIADVRLGDIGQALAAAMAWATRVNGIVCVAGSVYLAGETLELYEKGYR